MSGCLPPWKFPQLVTCEEYDACGTTEASSTGEGTPTTGEGGVHTVTGVGGSSEESSSGTGTDSEGGATTEQTAGPPTIVEREVKPHFTDSGAWLDVIVATDSTDGVRMLLENGEVSELMEVGPGAFLGHISAFSGFDNGEHVVVLTPWRDAIEGASVEADYVIALPPPGFGVSWQDGAMDVDGSVAAIATLPDGRPVEFGTYKEMGVSHCYLRLREKTGAEVEFVPVLPPAHCRAIDLAIHPDTGVMHVLLERKMGDDLVWWAGESAGWGISPKNIGTGDAGDTAHAVASRDGLVAVCGARALASDDESDGLAVLLRPDLPPEPRVFDYLPTPTKHKFGETVRDCKFVGDTLVLVGEAHGKHSKVNNEPLRDRVMVIEQDVDAAVEPTWTVAGPGPGVQSGALAVDVDDEGRYHLAGYTCLDVCEREGELRTYEPGGVLVEQVPLGPLGSAAFGPHAIAWSPAGYAVVALGALQGPTPVFKVQAFAPGTVAPLWTFVPSDQQGLQMALAVAAGPFGEIYAGGIGAGNHPAFAVVGG